ncbi:MAG TPA: diacylglycerol kinase family protein, partial [Chloroflexota bacterium]|nr:diacylglycerol kinase family protein [Chloroflexota bacterium]
MRREPSPAVRPVPLPGPVWRADNPGSVLAQERASFRYAFEGLRYSWTTQRHLRIHISLALLAVSLGLLLTISPVEWAALLAVIALVIALELLNTVIEVVVDMITREYNPQAKVAKDVAAAAVLIAAIGAATVGAVIFIPRILAFFV